MSEPTPTRHVSRDETVEALLSSMRMLQKTINALNADVARLLARLDAARVLCDNAAAVKWVYNSEKPWGYSVDADDLRAALDGEAMS
jgi:hypothetical protein